ncbi:MAG TPA: lysylphosphatidylglycerol synthase transmembrane domain-containing protein, partial [Candidatus Lustribacter sp.]|nr:lysylphosphatidylglycerol synthase transmembrane domain-containing protein [Candidatus Lustribacter sp.]
PGVLGHDLAEPVPGGTPIRRMIQFVVGVGLALGLLGWALPHFAKTSWGDVGRVLIAVPRPTAIGLLLLMLGGLWLYTFTFTGSLPGLSHGKAMIVNICGSSVGNLLPGGGAAGVAVTYSQLRSWGFSRRDISTSIIVTGVWNVLARLALPLLGTIFMIFGAGQLNPAVLRAALAGAVGGLGLLALFIAVLASDRAANVVGRVMERMVRPLRTWRARRWAKREGMALDTTHPTAGLDGLITDLRARTIVVVRHGWVSMTCGMVGFFGMFYMLFWFCLNSTGVQLPFAYMFFAYTLSRLLTAVGVTPGGLGVTETATAALLVGWGADPAQATAGVLIFTLFTHILEVPLGAIGWVFWSASRKTPADGSAEG